MSKPRRIRLMLCAFLGASLLLSSRNLWAHHSSTMYDLTKVVSLPGTVAKVDWRNPHVVVWIYLKNPATGNQDLYALETASILNSERRGWTSHTFESGDKITVEFNPLKDGRNGGYFVKAVKADGTVVTASAPVDAAPAPSGASNAPKAPKP